MQSIATSTQGTPRLRGFALFSVLAALMLTLLLEALDQTVVGTALPRIIGVLNGFDRYTWAVTAYTLASVTMVPIVGKLSDLFGRKWFLISGESNCHPGFEESFLLLGLVSLVSKLNQNVRG